MRNAGRYVGAWGAIALGVVLLSFLFTFLGTITCAVLVGMMMGALKGAKWFSVSVSVVFPVVIFSMARGARVELTMQQILLLAALCFGVFWVTYLVSAFVFFCEQKGRKPSELPAPALPDRTAAPDAQAAVTACVSAGDLSGSTVPASESCLEQLQGNWVCEPSSAGEPLCKKVIRIKEAKLELRTVDGSGRMTLVATGDVTLQGVRVS